MTKRVYLGAARFNDDPPQAGDLPAERIFIHASEVPELWVETEAASVPAAGKSVSFALTHHLDIGICRVTGTIERVVDKHTRERTSDR
jgi:hypothetical protein